MKDWIKSSQDPQKISSTVKGIAVSVAPIIVLIASQFGATITQVEIVQVSSQVGLAFGSILSSYGLVMKIVMRFGRKNE